MRPPYYTNVSCKLVMEYTIDDIKIISWPEPVRKRPSMYYKHLGNEGCIWLIKEVLESILNEKYQCKAKEVEIRYTRHKEIVIEYNGRGLPIALSTSGKIPEPIVYRALMGLFCGEFSEVDIKKYGHLAEIGSIFNAACKVLRVYTLCENKSYSMSFHQGCISTPLCESSTDSAMNKLQFTIDPDVLGNFEITETMLENIAESTQSKFQRAVVKYVS